MNVFYDAERGAFRLDTPRSSYIMALADGKRLGHVYYGPRLEDRDLDWAAGCLDLDEKPYTPDRCLSACLHLPYEGQRMVTLHGSWARERGEVYAAHFVYSGNFLAQVQRDQFDCLRLVMGIHPEEFSWKLEPGAAFQALGMRFGLWSEPEMVSEDSDVYRAHPDWVIQRGRRRPLRCRDQLALYRLQQKLMDEFPDLLLENCCSGGGRFDPGMLFYSPQIWCSDDTDAVERLSIQEGTAMLYPLSCIGAHVSMCPNHLVGRETPFHTRGIAAMAGTFGYELDVTAITEDEQRQIPEQIARFKALQPLIRSGDYYRISSAACNGGWDAQMVVSKDRKEAAVFVIRVLDVPNQS